MDKCRRLFQSRQAPDFRVGDLLHVQSGQHHSSFMMNNSKAMEFTAHLPRFGGLPPCKLHGLKTRRFPAFPGVFQIPRLFWWRSSHGNLKS